MVFDTNNNIVKLCAEGMMLEGEGKPQEAHKLFQQAWQESINNYEKCIAAHYLARHQHSVADKLKWDKTALDMALQVTETDMKETLPSLYLNIGKCYEDLNDTMNALENYKTAKSFTLYLPDDEYSKMIKSGIEKAIIRLQPVQSINN